MRLLLILLLVAPGSWAATRDFLFQWTQECLTTEGDDLDLDDDGICELLTGFRFYEQSGAYITGLPEDGTRTHTLRLNQPWGQRCFQMTAVMDDPVNSGQVLESAKSNVGACKDVFPGNPNAPVLEN